MFLIPKGIYFNIVKNIEDPDQLKRVQDLNAETNYLEKALRFHQLKSFKSQPREVNEQPSPDREINDSYATVNDDADAMQAEYFPQQTFDEQIEAIANAPPPILTRQRTNSISAPPVAEHNVTRQRSNSISAPPVAEHNAIFPVADLPQSLPQETREAASSQTETDRAKFLINWAINDILHSSSLKCPLCKNSADFKKAGFFARHMHQRHNYRLNAMEQRMVRENLDKLSQKQQQIKPKKKVLLNPSFLQSHREDMMDLHRAGKRPVFDQKLDETESQVKLGKLGQQEIDQQIREGKKRPTLKTNRRKIKKSFRPIPPDQWERIERTRQIERIRTGKRKNREDDEEEDDDEKVRKLNPTTELRELPFYLPPTLRGKRRRNEEDDDDEIILKKKRKMITKKFKPLRLMHRTAAKNLKLPTVKLNKSKLALKPEDGSLKLRTPTVKLNKSKLALKPEDGSLQLRTPTVKLNKSKLALKPEDGSLQLRTPTVKLNKSKLAVKTGRWKPSA